MNFLQEAAACYRRDNVQITVERVGQPVWWSTVDEGLMAELAQEHYVMMAALGLNPRILKAATDCRYPMSLGVPVLCLGLCYTIGPHRRDEYLVPDSLPTGLEFLLKILDSVQ